MESKQEEKFVLKQAEEELKKKQVQEEEKKAGAKPVEGKDAKEKPKAGEKAKKEPEKKEEKKREIVLERIYTIPLKRFLIGKPRMARHTRTAHAVRAFAAKHLKTGEDKVRIDNKVSVTLSRGGRNKLLDKVKVKISKDKEGVVWVEPAA